MSFVHSKILIAIWLLQLQSGTLGIVDPASIVLALWICNDCARAVSHTAQTHCTMKLADVISEQIDGCACDAIRHKYLSKASLDALL